MRVAVRLVLTAILLTTSPAMAQTQSFENMVEDALRRLQPGAPPAEMQPAPQPQAPLPPGAPATAPAAPPAPDLAPVELAPRPYTPPKLASPPARQTGSPPPTTPAQQATPDTGSAPTAAPAEPGAAPSTATPGTIAPVGPQAERTLASLTPDEVNGAVFGEDAVAARGANPIVLKAQVLLDRAGASPGVIDGYAGGNVAKAVAAVETVLGLPVDGVLDREVWQAIGGDNAPEVLIQYTITDADLAYRFLPAIPSDFAEQARLPALGYTSLQEMLGERFHMNVKLLAALNPQADFQRAGTTIWVASVDGAPISGTITRIEADKGRKQVRAYDEQNRLIVAYPATIGSPENPSPSGQHVVEGVAKDPVYYYDPKNFVQGDNHQQLQLPPGPNNPVGSIWIDLSAPSYGIHGTPEPTLIDKTGSHGCVRLTNWDATELAGLVQPGVQVTFVE